MPAELLILVAAVLVVLALVALVAGAVRARQAPAARSMAHRHRRPGPLDALAATIDASIAMYAIRRLTGRDTGEADGPSDADTPAAEPAAQPSRYVVSGAAAAGASRSSAAGYDPDERRGRADRAVLGGLGARRRLWLDAAGVMLVAAVALIALGAFVGGPRGDVLDDQAFPPAVQTPSVSGGAFLVDPSSTATGIETPPTLPPFDDPVDAAASGSATATASPTTTPSPTSSPTATPTTPTTPPTPRPTAVPSPSPSPSPTATVKPTPTPRHTPVPPSPTPSPTASPTPSPTPQPTPTAAPTQAPTPTPDPTPGRAGDGRSEAAPAILPAP